jgi:hypothetical protein
MRTKVVLLNGPPGCGKDTAGNYLAHCFPEVALKSFKTPLYAITAAIYDIPLDAFKAIASGPVLKEQPADDLMGLSPRQALIEVSENVIKPYYGEDYFGVRAVESLTQDHVNVFTDSGFMPEAESLITALDAENVLLIKIKGRGSFDGDSRGYLPNNRFNHVRTINNAFSEDKFLATVADVVENWCNVKYRPCCNPTTLNKSK